MSTLVMTCPACDQFAAERLHPLAAPARNGSRLRICEPICTCRPSSRTLLIAAASANQRRASSMATPNLFSDLPVEIFSCVPASTSGLMRTAARAHDAVQLRDLLQQLQLVRATRR